MQMAIVEVQLKEDDKEPEQHLDSGEFIERYVVPLSEAYDKLMAWSKDDKYIVDARLFHFIAGMAFAFGKGKEYKI